MPDQFSATQLTSYLVRIIAVCWAGFHVYTSYFGTFYPYVQRSIPVLCALVLTFLTTRAIKTPKPGVATEPGIYLMDEPMSSLDPPTRVQMREEITRVHREVGATTLYVTHNMADAFAMADRVVMMNDGKAVQVGTVEQLRTHPANDWVTAFLNSS